MLLRKLLPTQVYGEIIKLDRHKLNEIRFRVNQPVTVTVNGRRQTLGFVATKEDVSALVMRAADNSLYAHESEIIKGYINVGEGIRMGVCGEAVCDGNRVNTVKNIQAVNIRIPHEIKGASAFVADYIKAMCSIMVIAPGGGGKTTFLRDMAQKAGGEFKYNVTVIDERGELCAVQNGIPFFDMKGCDIITGHPRSYAFENALRSMSPEVAVTDEIIHEDLPHIISLAESGVSVFASAHGVSVQDAVMRFGERPLKRAFGVYALLCGRLPDRKVKIYDGDFNLIHEGDSLYNNNGGMLLYRH